VIIRAKAFTAGTKEPVSLEPDSQNANFTIYKFSERPKPSPAEILLVCCFSEFGCETLGPLYCIPRFKERYPGKYLIVVGWFGREYLYRHLADEFWELSEDNQFLREYCRAFHPESKNLDKIEKSLGRFGTVLPSSEMSKIAVGNFCLECKHIWTLGTGSEKGSNCPKCSSHNIEGSLFSNVTSWKSRVVRLPDPSKEKLKEAAKYLGANPVGIFGRNRKTYGRNLQPEFYQKLISALEGLGYTPIWLGEKQSTLPCPVSHITDFSRLAESRDLELTLAIIKQLKFTVQFWTASTRLSGLMGVPYLLFESPDQVVGNGQEGMRLELTTFGDGKVVYNHYLNVFNDNDGGIEVVKKAIGQMNRLDWRDLIGLVQNESVVRAMLAASKAREKGVV
jgi:hypothetical protein